MQKQLNIGLFGFGVVGAGLYQVIQNTPSLNATIKKIAIKHPQKVRNAPAELFTTDAKALLYDPEINVIVEVINDANQAWEIAQIAMQQGKAVVSASKQMIAAHLPEILALQESTGLPFLYEAAVCASIPVLRNLEEYYDNDLLAAVQGIVNGSTNFMLGKIIEEDLSFAQALSLAQDLGFAESNPSMDVDGCDAAQKLQLIVLHAFGILTQGTDILTAGISKIHARDVQYAKEKNYVIKLVAQAVKLEDGGLASFVLPQFVPAKHLLASVNSEYNAVLLESGFAEQQFFYGKGAGSLPTASAVLSDLSALSYDYKYAYKKFKSNRFQNDLAKDFLLPVYISFEDKRQVPLHLFETIYEQFKAGSHHYLTGQIAYKHLKEGTWWRQGSCSLLLLPEALSLSSLEAKSAFANSGELEYF